MAFTSLRELSVQCDSLFLSNGNTVGSPDLSGSLEALEGVHDVGLKGSGGPEGGGRGEGGGASGGDGEESGGELHVEFNLVSVEGKVTTWWIVL